MSENQANNNNVPLNNNNNVCLFKGLTNRVGVATVMSLNAALKPEVGGAEE